MIILWRYCIGGKVIRILQFPPISGNFAPLPDWVVLQISLEWNDPHVPHVIQLLCCWPEMVDNFVKVIKTKDVRLILQCWQETRILRSIFIGLIYMLTSILKIEIAHIRHLWQLGRLSWSNFAKNLYFGLLTFSTQIKSMERSRTITLPRAADRLLLRCSSSIHPSISLKQNCGAAITTNNCWPRYNTVLKQPLLQEFYSLLNTDL